MCVAKSFSGVDMGRRDEVMLLVVSVLVLKLVVDRWGPGRLRGMASCGEADDG
jgi:hypothetical protein